MNLLQVFFYFLKQPLMKADLQEEGSHFFDRLLVVSYGIVPM
jgi:hypothetical protein